MFKTKLMFREILNLPLIPISYYMNKPFTKPLLAGLFLTNKCNSRCEMCSYWQEKNTNFTQINYKQGKRIIDELKQFDIKILSFSAEGEIFTNSDALKIIEYAKRLGFLFSINTNGLCINKSIAKNIAHLNPYSLIIGLDTLGSKKYEQIRGVNNGLNKVLKSINYLKDENFQNISLGTVILFENIDELEKLTNFVIENKLKNIRFTAYQQLGFGCEFNEAQHQKYIDRNYQIKLNTTITNLIKLKKRHNIISNSISYLKMIPKSFINRNFKPIKCMQGFLSFNICSNGDVILCQIMDRQSKIGNIYQNHLKDIWYSDKAYDIRYRIKKGQCPGCWLSCYAEENLRYSLKYGFHTNLNKLKRGLSL